MIPTRHCRIAVAEAGPADAALPPLVFIHGNSACKEAFVHQFAHFSRDRRVVAFDLPGHGASENADPEDAYNVPAYADVAEDVIAALNLDRPIVFGWSLGGYVALELTARAPERFTGLAIAGTTPLNIVPEDFARGYDAASHVILAGKQYLTRLEAARFANAATAPRSPMSEHMHENFNRTDGRARFYMITKLSVVDWPRQMRMLREGALPFAILNGSDDPFLNHSHIAGLPYGAIWSGAPSDIAGGSHAPFFNKPSDFNRLFADFAEHAEKSSG